MLSLEAPVLAAMVTASVTIFSKIVEWAGSRDAKVAAQAQKVVEQAYDPLRQKLTDGCVRVLKYLEDREYRMTSVIRAAVHPPVTIPNDFEDTFDGEFRYQMEYLRKQPAKSY